MAKFKIGDRVRLVEDGLTEEQACGVVEYVTEDDGGPYYDVLFDDGYEDVLNELDLEPA